MANHVDVLIVGGGVIGLTAARALRERGQRVAILDRGPVGREASWAGAGIVPPGNPERARTPLDRLRAISSQAYPDFCASLRDATGIDPGYRLCGGLEFLEDVRADTARWDAESVPWLRWDTAALREREPGLMRSGPAFELPGMAQVRNPRLLRALAAWLENRGALVASGAAVEGLTTAGTRITGVRTDQGDWSADHYLIAAGAWSAALLAPLGIQLRVKPIRGQIVLLRTIPDRPRRIILEGKRYLVPRGDGLVLVGSTEEDAGFHAETTEAARGELLAFARDLLPELAGATIERSWAGLRPGSPDGKPYLGRIDRFDNLWIAAGHFRAGVQQAPATGQALAAALCGEVPDVPLEAFRWDRPDAPPENPAFRS